MSIINDPSGEAMAARFGMGMADLQRLIGTPRKEATELLEQMKAEAKRRFQDLALELHPDHNPDDQDAGRKLSLAVKVRDYLLGLRVGPNRRPGDPEPQSYRERQDEWVKRAREERQAAREARVREANVSAARDSKIHHPTAAETSSYGEPEDTPREDDGFDLRARSMGYGVGVSFYVPFITDA